MIMMNEGKKVSWSPTKMPKAEPTISDDLITP